MDELKEYAPSEVVICLAGNKMDIPGAHAVNMQEGQNFARKHQIQVCKEVSAKTNEGVDALFHAVAMQCWEKRDQFVSETKLVTSYCAAITNEKHFQARKIGGRASTREEKEKGLLQMTISISKTALIKICQLNSNFKVE